MKQFALRIFLMIFGLALYALGIVVTIKANIGYAPWEVFHAGLLHTFGFSMGFFSIVVGLVIVIIVILLKEKIGLGTISNMVLIGVFMDIFLFLDFVPVPEYFVVNVLLLVSGLFIISVGSYFYIKSAFGAGPRDSLMVVLTRRTKIPVGVCRSIIELSVTIAGWALGGMVGIGTVISVIGIGFCIQITFRIFQFDVTMIRHETLPETFGLKPKKAKR